MDSGSVCTMMASRSLTPLHLVGKKNAAKSLLFDYVSVTKFDEFSYTFLCKTDNISHINFIILRLLILKFF